MAVVIRCCDQFMHAFRVVMVVHRVLLRKQSKPKTRTLYLFDRALFSCKVYDENRVVRAPPPPPH